MRRYFPLCVAVVGALMSLPMSRQLATAQPLPEPDPQPTIDERYRDRPSQADESEMPRLNAPQSKSSLDMTVAGKNSGAPFLGVTFVRNERAPVVQSVAAGGPAEQAGLQPNDLIETLQGRRVRTSQDVLDIVARMRPGDVLDIEFSRRLNIRTQAPLASAPPSGPHSAGYPPSTFAAPEDPTMQSNRDSYSQNRYDASNEQRRVDSQKNNRTEDNRRLLNRLLRRR
jgi:membrane-associated protease RseP (regulator of RpoE activity)